MGITINTSGLGENKLKAISEMFNTPKGRKANNTQGGRAVQQFLKRYHREFSRNRGWDNPSLPTHGRGRRSTRFGTGIVDAWQPPVASVNHVDITNSDPKLTLKVYGGLVTPNTKKWLTIPVRPDAHGKSVDDFQSQYKRKLFRPKGKNWLAYKLKGGALRIAYLLKKGHVFDKWPGALPSDDEILDVYWEEGILPKINRQIVANERNNPKR